MDMKKKGSTTTPFDMLARNKVSRYDIAVRALNSVNKGDEVFESLAKEYQKTPRRCFVLCTRKFSRFARDRELELLEV